MNEWMNDYHDITQVSELTVCFIHIQMCGWIFSTNQNCTPLREDSILELSSIKYHHKKSLLRIKVLKDDTRDISIFTGCEKVSSLFKRNKSHEKRSNPVFHKLDEIRNNANIAIRGFTTWKQKKSSDKMLPLVGIEPRPLITSDSKSNFILSGLTWHFLLRLRL